MSRTGWSFARIRRSAAIWLIAAWAVFGMSQALALCCADIGGLAPVHGGASDTQPDEGMAVHHHCGDESGNSVPSPSSPATSPNCPMDLGEAPPPAASAVSTALLLDIYSSPLPSSMGTLPHVAAVEHIRAPAPLAAQSPPHPIYLRLERFLI